jgi:hypothetical protein
MCFSATASFMASGILATVGVLSIRSVKRWQWYLFASVPLLFAIQQLSEGFVWLYGTSSAGSLAASIFLFFALGIWPTVIPLAFLLVEPHMPRKILLGVLTLAGLSLSGFLLASLWYQAPEFSAQGCHIIYTFYPVIIFSFLPTLWTAVVYCLATIAPFFISSKLHMKVFGALIALSCIAAYLFFTIYFISVWCFFAAIISAVTIGVMHKNS